MCCNDFRDDGIIEISRFNRCGRYNDNFTPFFGRDEEENDRCCRRCCPCRHRRCGICGFFSNFGRRNHGMMLQVNINNKDTNRNDNDNFNSNYNSSSSYSSNSIF